MTAKEFLKDIRKMDLEIKTLNDQIVQLRHAAEGLKSMELSDMPRGAQGKNMADYVAELANMQLKCAQYVSELVDKKQNAIDYIMSIDGSELRNVLLLRYIQCKDWDDIANKLQYNPRTIFRLHGEALKEFEKVVSKCQ